MPRYDFECHDCHKTFELDLKIAEKDTPSTKRSCPHCHSQKLAQLMTFKGGIGTKSSSNSQGPCASNGGGCSTGMCPFSQ